MEQFVVLISQSNIMSQVEVGCELYHHEVHQCHGKRPRPNIGELLIFEAEHCSCVVTEYTPPPRIMSTREYRYGGLHCLKSGP